VVVVLGDTRGEEVDETEGDSVVDDEGDGRGEVEVLAEGVLVLDDGGDTDDVGVTVLLPLALTDAVPVALSVCVGVAVLDADPVTLAVALVDADGDGDGLVVTVGVTLADAQPSLTAVTTTTSTPTAAWDLLPLRATATVRVTLGPLWGTSTSITRRVSSPVQPSLTLTTPLPPALV
jgi:hypothetical protein